MNVWDDIHRSKEFGCCNLILETCAPYTILETVFGAVRVLWISSFYTFPGFAAAALAQLSSLHND